MLDFWFDYSCPYAYLASRVVERVAALRGAQLSWQPMLLGGVFRARGVAQNLMGELAPSKAAHNVRDMKRWAELLGVPLQVPAAHPQRTVEALRVTLASGIDPAVIHGLFRAYWERGEPVSDPAVLRRVLGEARHEVEATLQRAGSDAIKSELRVRTDRALELGVFGAPAMIDAHGALVWGVDRMPFVSGRSFAETYGLPEMTYAPRMAHTLDLYWDFSSPYAYLGSTQAEALAARTGASLRWRPMLLGGVFRAIGQADAPIATFSEAKRQYAFVDMMRWAKHWDVPFAFPSRFPMSTVKALRAYLALPEERRADFRGKTFRAYWAEDKDISSDAVLADLLGSDADDVLAKTQTPAIKQELIEATDAAVKAGVFGAPTWVVDGDELFWGQDRLELVERALRA